MNFIFNLLGGFALFVAVVLALPILALWFCVDLVSIKFGDKK